ncbi:MAG: hypothetical protein ISP90_10160 [Nevskia sp.]|nr:hypothetical protein [Nevskia sp.]
MQIPALRHRRILVTGNAGSGKSTLAGEIGRILALPVYGLDQIVWRPGWRSAPAQERDTALHELAAADAWVIDGVSRVVESNADLVVFLDLPPAACTLRCAKRNWRYLFRSRPGLPPDCPELLIVPKLLSIIWRFDKDVRPKLLERAARPLAGQAYRCLKTSRDIAELLAELRFLAAGRHPVFLGAIRSARSAHVPSGCKTSDDRMRLDGACLTLSAYPHRQIPPKDPIE